MIHYGHIVASYRRSRGTPLVLDDSATAPAKPIALDG